MKNIYVFLITAIRFPIFRLISLFIKRQENYIAIGSWVGERYADNSRYLMEYLDSNYPQFTLYWVGKKNIKDEVLANTQNVVFLEQNKLSTDIKLLKCKYFFFSQMHSADISRSNVFMGAKLCYLHHGMPIKKWGADGLNQGENLRKVSFKSRLFSYISGISCKYDYFVTSSSLHDEKNCTALDFKGATLEKNIHTGTPRNDMLINFDSIFAKKMKKIYSNQFDFSSNVKVIMYLPTYRRISKDIFSFSKLTPEQESKLIKILTENNAVLIEKSHVAEREKIVGVDSERIKFADKNTNIQEMMLFTDVLISDYSGAFLDFILLDRPVIHYAYDYDYYKNVDSGLYYEIDEFSAGAVSLNFDSLLNELEILLDGKDDYRDKRLYVRNKFMEYETGCASKQIVDKVIFSK